MSQAEKNQLATVATNQVRSLLERSRAEIAAALPNHLTADRMVRLAFTEFRQNTALLDCEPKSFVGAVIQASQLGLEIGRALGQVWLIPFRNNKTGQTECSFVLGYRGMIALALRSGEVASIVAHAVHEGDHFEYELGLNEILSHKPSEDPDREAKPITHVYAVAFRKDGVRPQFEVMTASQIEKVRAGSKSGNFGPWKDHPEEMSRKTAVRKLFKYLPISIEMRDAIQLDDMANSGLPQDNAALLDAPKEDAPPADKKSIKPKDRDAAMKAAVSSAENFEDSTGSRIGV